MVKLYRIRGRTLKFYFLVTAFGVASGVYILRPILDELEKRHQQAEQASALKSLEAASKIK